MLKGRRSVALKDALMMLHLDKTKAKQNQNKNQSHHPRMRDLSRASSELQVIAKNCDWLIALPSPLVIGRSNCFGLVFGQSFENRSISIVL